MIRRIESKTSRTAEYTCLARGLSYLDKRKAYKSEDYISLEIMNSFVKLLIRIPQGRKYFLGVQPAGMYEYVISRTKYIDSEMQKALQEGIEQVVILGAGFDSRGIRFKDISKNARIFELDAPVTQKAKINRYLEKEIEIPENLIFAPIDFEKDSIPEKLLGSGFKKDKKSLFILEGLTMYLQPESVDQTFKIIRELSGTGNKVVFDHIYASVVRRDNLFEGEKELFSSVAKKNESFHFGIEKGSIHEFLSRYGFDAFRIMDSNALENIYFKDESGNPLGKVNGTHCIVTAITGSLT